MQTQQGLYLSNFLFLPDFVICCTFLRLDYPWCLAIRYQINCFNLKLISNLSKIGRFLSTGILKYREKLTEDDYVIEWSEKPLNQLGTNDYSHTITPTIPLIPLGYKKRLYKVSTVSFGSISTLFCSNIGPVSKPSSAQNTVNPPCLSPSIKVLG